MRKEVSMSSRTLFFTASSQPRYFVSSIWAAQSIISATTCLLYTSVKAAAELYFDKDVSELNLIECAAIAGITQNPSQYNPITNPEANKKRRSLVLSEMLKQGMISQEEYDSVDVYKRQEYYSIT